VLGKDELDAGEFSSWLNEVTSALRGDRSSDVPCAGCTACCTASQFIHVGPAETQALARIPPEFLFPAPGLPPGHVIIGYDDFGRCPLVGGAGCSIHDDRPHACRAYDCRLFAAVGIEPADESQSEVARQSRRWRFALPTQLDRDLQGAVRAAAEFLAAHGARLPDEDVPRNATQLAVLALEIHDVFLAPDKKTGRLQVVRPDWQAVQLAVLRRSGRGRRAAVHEGGRAGSES
jgi:uncharacterized protein